MLTPKKLTRSILGNVAAAVYTADPAVTTRIDAMVMANFSAGPATFSIWIVPAAAVNDDTNILISARSVAAGVSVRVLEAIGQWLQPGDQLFMVASVANTLTVTSSGVEKTG